MCCQIKAFSEKRIQIKTGSLSVLHLYVSLRANLKFLSMRNSDMVMVQKNFRILKLAQITRSSIEHLSKNSVSNKFPKKL